jgi:hypothetical protein
MMRSYSKRFAMLGLVLGAALAGCTVEQVDATPQGVVTAVGGTVLQEAGTGGAGGTATGGAGGAGGTATGGASGSGGTTEADATTDASGECWGDETGLDAANLAADCQGLPYAAADCDGGVPAGVSDCLYIADKYRAGVFEGVYNCLGALPVADACTEAHVTAADTCVTDVSKQACPLTYGGYVTDAGVYNCLWLSQDCPGTDAGGAAITEADCNTWMSWLTPAWRDQSFSCYLDTTPNPETCAADFKNCAFPP